MSDTFHSSSDTVANSATVPAFPPLRTGERLDQATFHARYAAMPSGTRAELIGGVVQMMSPMKHPHGRYQRSISAWLYQYELATPGVEGGDGLTVILDQQCEPQPDACLMIRRSGQTRVNADDYIEGAPELVVEISLSTESRDLNAKKADYERAGVREYVVVAIGLNKVLWFVWLDGKYTEHPADSDGVFRSIVFPGLWLDADALLTFDGHRLHDMLQAGVASATHADFCRLLARHGSE